MVVEFDLSAIPQDNPIAFGWWFFRTIGWIVPVFLFVWGMFLLYQNWIRNQYRAKRKYMILAIDVPRLNLQSPKAIENMFNHLAGAHQPLKRYQKWWTGEIPDSFGFEIISIGGSIQYLIHFEQKYRDLIEAMLYAQYPDAEITEVDDYVTRYKGIRFPHEKYDLFGTELKLTNKQWYPIITHREFEDSLSQELKDPMSSILEALGRITPGEELWLQFLITPADNDWSKGAQAEIDKMIGKKSSGSKGILDTPIIKDLWEAVTATIQPIEVNVNVEKSGPENRWLSMTDGEKSGVKAVEGKSGHIGFHTRIRYVYIAEKEKMNKVKAVQTFYGAFKQYNSLGLNGFKADSKYYTGAIVWFKKQRLIWRKNKIFFRYINRGHFLGPGEYGPVLIAEELASLWHFPGETVKAPLIQKTQAKRSEPPTTLPREEAPIPEITQSTGDSQKGGPPVDLPTQ